MSTEIYKGNYILGIFFNRSQAGKPAIVLTEFSLEIRNPDLYCGEFWPPTMTVRDNDNTVWAELIDPVITDTGKGRVYIRDSKYWLMIVRKKKGDKCHE